MLFFIASVKTVTPIVISALLYQDFNSTLVITGTITSVSFPLHDIP